MKKLILALALATVAGGALLVPAKAEAYSPGIIQQAIVAQANQTGSTFLDNVVQFLDSPLVKALGILAFVGGLIIAVFMGNLQQGFLYMGLGGILSVASQIITWLFNL